MGILHVGRGFFFLSEKFIYQETLVLFLASTRKLFLAAWPEHPSALYPTVLSTKSLHPDLLSSAPSHLPQNV